MVLTSGILTITTLLPLVPASIGHCLQDLFDIFSRLSAFRARRSGIIHLHLHQTDWLSIFPRIKLTVYTVCCTFLHMSVNVTYSVFIDTCNKKK